MLGCQVNFDVAVSVGWPELRCLLHQASTLICSINTTATNVIIMIKILNIILGLVCSIIREAIKYQ